MPKDPFMDKRRKSKAGMNLPNDGKGKGCIDVYEQRSNFVLVVEDETVSPCDNSTGK